MGTYLPQVKWMPLLVSLVSRQTSIRQFLTHSAMQNKLLLFSVFAKRIT